MADMIPADEQPRTKLDRSDPNQTNSGTSAGEQDTAAAPTEQESGGGYGNHAPAEQGGA
jgi:hypothetical protein